MQAPGRRFECLREQDGRGNGENGSGVEGMEPEDDGLRFEADADCEGKKRSQITTRCPRLRAEDRL